MQHLTSYRTWNILIQPKQVRTDAIDRVSNITYNPRGQRENIYYGNNTKTKYEYNFFATNAMQNYTQHYQYDALGNMLQMQSQNRWTRDYIYATATNRLLKHDSQQTFDDYTYDEHGNMLSMLHLSNMSWDYLDQLHSATNGTFVSYYNYDAEGNRTRKVVEKNNIREERYYVNGYEIYRKYVNGTLDVERKTVTITDDEKVFVRIEQKTGETEVIRYQYDNHLGSSCLELDDGGQIISYEEYHPFGTTSYRSGRTETEVSLKRYKYCGKERDEETGLYYYGMRYYAAWICRFVSVDPLQFKYPYYTPYQYAGNKPVSYIDLDGGEEKKVEYKIEPLQTDYVIPFPTNPVDPMGGLGHGTSITPLPLKRTTATATATTTKTSTTKTNSRSLNLTSSIVTPTLPTNQVDPIGGLGISYAQQQQTAQQAEQSVMVEQNQKKVKKDYGEIKPLISEYEKNWETSAGYFANYIRFDPIIKSVAVGGVLVIGGVALGSGASAMVPGAYNAAVNTYKAVSMFYTTPVGKVGTGIIMGYFSYKTDVSPDVQIPDPVSNISYQTTNFLFFIYNNYPPIDSTKNSKNGK